jgi:hypothetical protein
METCWGCRESLRQYPRVQYRDCTDEADSEQMEKSDTSTAAPSKYTATEQANIVL